jgi:hypothetical protein
LTSQRATVDPVVLTAGKTPYEVENLGKNGPGLIEFKLLLI